jgi:hypothetical protein
MLEDVLLIVIALVVGCTAFGILGFDLYEIAHKRMTVTEWLRKRRRLFDALLGLVIGLIIGLLGGHVLLCDCN